MKRASGDVSCETGDTEKERWLRLMLSNFSNSYKLFFLQGILDLCAEDKERVGLYEMSARMVAGAWHAVMCHDISFGP